MTASPIEQYKEILDGLPRPPISTEGEKYEKFKRIAKILSEIFTPIVWVEWENNYQGLLECFEGRIDPNEFDTDYRRIHEGKYPSWFPSARLTPRLTTYLIVALSDFGIEKIEQYIAKNRDLLTRFFSEEDLYAFSAGWYNACETGKHIFQNFKPMLGRGNEEPRGLDPKEIKRLMQGSAMLDTATFNRYSIRNFSVNVSGILDHTLDERLSLDYNPEERIGCPAVRHFRGISMDSSVFDELFTRICTIYGYNPVEGAIQSVINQVHSTCPFHHPESSQSSQLPSEISKI